MEHREIIENKVTQPEIQLDTFICVHERDIKYLFELALRSYQLNFNPKGNLFFITNNEKYLRDYLASKNVDHLGHILSDDQVLTKKEQSLPGWYRQQIIKLRSYEFCKTTYFCSLGADTILLREINVQDIIYNNMPILYYRIYPGSEKHFNYEQQRITYIAEILGIEPAISRLYGDFIFDLFCFKRDYLVDLNSYLQKLYQKEYYYTLLRGRDDKPSDRIKFGEWTLYSIYVLDILKADIYMKNSATEYLQQVYREKDLISYKYDSKIVHFVDKNFDKEQIKQELRSRGFNFVM